MFHTIDDRQSAISFPPQVFQRAIGKLHDFGYQTLNLLEAWEGLRQGTEFPKRALVITFDDGYETVYREAFPILQRYGMSATVFLTVGDQKTGNGRLPSLEGRSMLSWSEIKEMQRGRMDFGAHTLTHPDLTRLPIERAESEICDSKAIIEDALSAQVDIFAYPFGRYDERCREIVRQNFIVGCSDELGLVRAGSDRYALERVDASYLRRDRLFDIMLTRLFPWYIWARGIPRRIWPDVPSVSA
jgi:peptidoglycan/xylan/chitin deacetylase (PgdA/CDA1 family)